MQYKLTKNTLQICCTQNPYYPGFELPLGGAVQSVPNRVIQRVDSSNAYSLNQVGDLGGGMFNDTVIEAIRYANADHIDLRALNLGEHDITTPTAKATAIGHILPLVKYQPLAQREDIVNELAHRITRAHRS